MEIEEELGSSVEVGQSLGIFSTPQDNYLIQLECFWCAVQNKHVSLSSHDESGWFSLNELKSLDWALPDLPVLEMVLRTLADAAASKMA